METEIKYLLQMTCWLAGFWMVYFFFLKKETHYHLNRFFLLSGVICSLLIPLIPIHYLVLRELPVTQTLQLNHTILTESTNLKSFDSLFLMKMIYLVGLLIVGVRFLIQVVKLIILRSKGEKIRISNTEIYQLEKETAPFSFFNKIYVSKSMGEESVLETVVAHEKVHIQQRHWADLLLLELVRAIQWFNPLVFIYRKAMMENHEYLADSGAIGMGMSERNYQAVLINQMLGAPVIQLASSFTMFNPSKRITMMKKDKSKPIQKWKVLWALPAIALILVAFVEPKYAYTNDTSILSTSDKQITVTGKVLDQEGNGLHGTSILIYHNTRGTVSDLDGNFILSGVLPDDQIVFSFVGFKTQRIKANEKMIIKMERTVVPISTTTTKAKEDAPPPPPATEITNREEPEEVFFIVEDLPQFKGGKTELVKFIDKATANSKEKGTVSVNFVVNTEGEIEDIEIIDSPSRTLSEKTVKIMKSMPDWEPGIQRGKPVIVNSNLQITF